MFRVVPKSPPSSVHVFVDGWSRMLGLIEPPRREDGRIQSCVSERSALGIGRYLYKVGTTNRVKIPDREGEGSGLEVSSRTFLSLLLVINLY